mmetsp:Transcript_13251/g.20725  ORF Transcript_13251/g.20725 Transcript_13251/m.20725 type:complete len:80 (-) Transcript_13251:663-902(-)
MQMDQVTIFNVLSKTFQYFNHPFIYPISHFSYSVVKQTVVITGGEGLDGEDQAIAKETNTLFIPSKKAVRFFTIPDDAQ